MPLRSKGRLRAVCYEAHGTRGVQTSQIRSNPAMASQKPWDEMTPQLPVARPAVDQPVRQRATTAQRDETDNGSDSSPRITRESDQAGTSSSKLISAMRDKKIG